MDRILPELYSPKVKPYQMDHRDVATYLANAVINCFNQHYENNSIYKFFTIQMGIYPNLKDIGRIPILPRLFFESGPRGEFGKEIAHIISVPATKIIHQLTIPILGNETETSHYFPFDAESMNYSLVGISKTIRYIYDISPEDSFYFLTPCTKGITELDKAMKSALSEIFGHEKVNDHIFFAFDSSDEIINEYKVEYDLNRLTKKSQKVHIYGSTKNLIQISEKIIEKGININLPLGTFALFSDGRNSDNQKKTQKNQVNEKIKIAFGIPAQYQRQNYGVVEMMQIFPQCEAGFFHIHPGVILSIRNRSDPFLIEEVPIGEEGQICIINPMIWSFPPFIATEETGFLVTPNKKKCACGKYGPTFSIGERKGLPTFCCLEHEILNSGLVFVLEDKDKNKPYYSINPQNF